LAIVWISVREKEKEKENKREEVMDYERLTEEGLTERDSRIPIEPSQEKFIDTKFNKDNKLNEKKHIPLQLTWTDVSCTLDTSSGPPCRRTHSSKEILRGVNGFAKPGTITAIIGSSGAGKSTLLDILSGRKNLGSISGDIFLNGAPRDARFKRCSAYVTQEDILLPTLTVYETLMLHVRLKMERLEGISSEERDRMRDERVREMIAELGLEKVANVRVGDENKRGISGGEKKRLSVGCEMIADPSLMFLDEPTTGLDAFNSQQVIYTLKKLARQGRTIICTLHQPRSSIFSMFDYLCCLSEGRVVYFGAAGGAVDYFEREIEQKCSAYFNPADFIIDVSLEDERRRFALKQGVDLPPEKMKVGPLTGDTSLADIFQSSSLHSENQRELQRLSVKTNEDLIEVAIEEDEEEEYRKHEDEPFLIPEVTRFAVSWPYQFAYLMQRQVKHLIRTPQTSVLVIFQSIFLSLFIGSLYHGTLDGPVSNVNQRVQNTQGVLFFCMVNLAFGQMQALLQFVGERKLFMKEKAAGMYQISAYYLAKNFSDVPGILLGPVTFCTIAYYFVGFRPAFTHFLTFVAIILTLVTTMTSFFTFFGALTKTPQVAQIFAALPIVVFLLFGGFYVVSDTIPDYYSWIQWLSPFKYAFAALLQNQFEGNCICDNVDKDCPIECQGDTYIYCEDEGQCLLGDEALNLWVNVFILLGMALVYRILGYIALRTIYTQKR